MQGKPPEIVQNPCTLFRGSQHVSTRKQTSQRV